MSKKGKPPITGFQSHYVLTNKDGEIYNPATNAKSFDEIVVFQENCVSFFFFSQHVRRPLIPHWKTNFNSETDIRI